jgi:hypothetical protein
VGGAVGCSNRRGLAGLKRFFDFFFFVFYSIASSSSSISNKKVPSILSSKAIYSSERVFRKDNSLRPSDAIRDT